MQVTFNLDETDYNRFVVKTAAVGMTPAEFLKQLIADWTYGDNAGKQYCHDAIENYCSVAGFSYTCEPSLMQYICNQIIGTDELDGIRKFLESIEEISKDEKELIEIESLAKKSDSGYTKEDIDEAKEFLESDREYYQQLRKEFDIESFCKKHKLNEEMEVDKLKQWYYSVQPNELAKDKEE